MSDTEYEVARALLDIGAVGFSPEQPITFKGGIVSPVYVDNRRLIYHPAALYTVIAAFEAQAVALAFDVVAGVAVGGVPYSAVLGYTMRRPSVFVRKAAKGHGKAQQVEGGDVAGQRVLLVEDLVTTGGSSLAGADALRGAGATVTDCLTVVSYDFAAAHTGFAAAGITLHRLTPFTVIRELALQRGLFDTAAAAIIDDWFADPYGWAAKYNKDAL